MPKKPSPAGTVVVLITHPWQSTSSTTLLAGTVTVQPKGVVSVTTVVHGDAGARFLLGCGWARVSALKKIVKMVEIYIFVVCGVRY
jgi:hypothetical protein